jgi:hypothetical protein
MACGSGAKTDRIKARQKISSDWRGCDCLFAAGFPAMKQSSSKKLDNSVPWKLHLQFEVERVR